MRRYYYTLAGLPMLFFDQAPPFSFDELLYMCRGNIADDDISLLEGLSLEPKNADQEEAQPEESCEALERWYTWERALRNELVNLRAANLAWEAERHRRAGEFETGVLSAAKNAAAQDSPLAAEELLDKARWNFLEELETGKFFELTNLIVYSLKLKILLRRSTFTRENGEEKYGEIYAKIKEDIQSA